VRRIGKVRSGEMMSEEEAVGGKEGFADEVDRR
jgi:hypothetical protein